MPTADAHTAHHLGTPPRNTTLNFTISLGLVNVPVRLLAGLDAKTTGSVEKHEYIPVKDGQGNVVEHRRAGRLTCDAETKEPVSKDDIVKMATATSGVLVPITDDEIAEATEKVKGFAEVVTTVPLDTIGTLYHVDSVGHVRAQKANGKPDIGADRALCTLLAALEAEKVGALMRLANRGAARWVILMPDGRLLTMAFAEAVRPAPALPTVEIDDRHLNLARQLVKSLGPTTPVLNDTDGPIIQALIDSKAEGIVPVAVDEPEAAPVVDLMAALEASLAAARANAEAA